MTGAARSCANGWSTRNRAPRASRAAKSAWDHPALSVRTMTASCPGSRGSGASGASGTGIGSAALPEPACPWVPPNRQGSPGGVRAGEERGEAVAVLVGGPSAFLVGMGGHPRAVDVDHGELRVPARRPHPAPRGGAGGRDAGEGPPARR
jgi:hypothetical protein